MIEPFVSVDWVRNNRALLVIADVRFYLDGRSGAEAYEEGHIPGAVFVDLERWLAGPATPEAGRHPLPDPAVFAEGMGLVGISNDATVVAYDDAGGVMAGRLVWMLRALGVDAALLDGGINNWPESMEVGAPTPERADFAPQPWPSERLATIEDAQDPSNVVLDARPQERFAGGADDLDPRFGHIPGARSLPCRENLEGGRLLSTGELRARFEAVGVHEESSVVSYCGSGVTACHNLLVLEQLGLPPGRLYPGSWSQYAHTDLPLATGT